jgi:membrane protein
MTGMATGAGQGDAMPGPSVPRRERVRRWVQGRRVRLEQARDTSTTVDVAFDALSYDTDTGATVLAAALGFRVFLFQVPYACLFVILAGYLSDWTGRDVHSLFHGRGVVRLTANSVSSAAELSGWTRFIAFVLVAYALILSARSLVKVMNIVHALVWDVPRRPMASATRAGAAFIGVITVLVGLSLGIGKIREHTAVGGLLLLLLYTAAPFAAWWFVSWRLPHRECPLIALAPGATFFGIGFELLHLLTVVWFPHLVESKSQVYGTVGLALAMLLWAYLLGRIITLAVVLNAALWARYGAESEHPIRVPRPSWHLPMGDEAAGRLWVSLFGERKPDEPDEPDASGPPGS